MFLTLRSEPVTRKSPFGASLRTCANFIAVFRLHFICRFKIEQSEDCII